MIAARTRIPAPICILPGFGHVRVQCDPGAREGGYEAAPYNVPDRSAALQVSAR